MLNKNTYLILPGSPSDINSLSHHSSTSVLGLTADEILFHHHHDMLSGNYFTDGGDAPVVDAEAFFSHQDVVGGLNEDPSGMANSFPRAAKKDRHSKISTSQGPRDRRVRLSIGVARRFFDLQESLGFDKPSKTLEWLLTKSKTAITDLVQSSKGKATKSVSSSPSEVDSAENERFDSKRKLVEMNSADNKHKDSSKQSSDLAKESRVKARARARERTREKMCIKKLNETRNGAYDDLILNPSIPVQYMNNQLEFCKISGSSCSDDSTYGKANEGIREAMLYWHPSYEAPNEDLIQEESILIKPKVKHPSVLDFQQNLFISSSNYAVPSPFNPTDNWDISTSFASQSNICAILDQHKFINSYD